MTRGARGRNVWGKPGRAPRPPAGTLRREATIMTNVNPQGMHRTARADDGDAGTRADACREAEYRHNPDHGFTFTAPAAAFTSAESHIDFAALFVAGDDELPVATGAR